MPARTELIAVAKLRVREAFACFETKDGAVIAERDLAAVVRVLGFNINEQQASQILQVRFMCLLGLEEACAALACWRCDLCCRCCSGAAALPHVLTCACLLATASSLAADSTRRRRCSRRFYLTRALWGCARCVHRGAFPSLRLLETFCADCSCL